MLTRGHLDICQQRYIAGWAVLNGGTPTIAVIVNGEEITRFRTDQHRPDVCAALGIEGNFGFARQLPVPIKAADQLTLLMVGTGEHLDTAAHQARVDQMTYGIDRGKPGLELGALDNPFLSKDAFSVFYVDHASRADLIEKYKGTGTEASFDARQVVEPDFVWTPGRPLAECLPNEKFAYAIASQVMEHVANPIGWLNLLADCLAPGGRVNLSIPDMRKTFDYKRRLTSASDMLDAYERELAQPDFRQVFDHIANMAHPPADVDHSPSRLHEALAVGRLAGKQYVDVHCHVWTHDSFLECWDVIDKLDACKLKLDKSWAPVFSHQEFILSFRK